jgi:hypothetical protein
MFRSTCSGCLFSPYNLDISNIPPILPTDIIRTNIDITALLQAAMAEADLHASGELIPLADNDPDWEDKDQDFTSPPTSPLSELTASEPPTRATSPSSFFIGEGHHRPDYLAVCTQYATTPPPH